MTPTPAQVSVAELLASGVRPYPDEAIAIVQQVCRHRLRGSPGVLKASLPTPETLTIDASGTVSFFGTVLAEGGAAVVHLARMLHSMLPEPGTAAALYVPSALTVTLVRGLSEMVLPTFGSVEAFSHRLEPFEPVDGAQALRGLFERWRQAHPVASQMAAAGPEPLVDLQLHPQELPLKAAPPRERPKEPWSGLDRRMPQLEEVESDIPVPPHLVLQAPSRDDDRSLRSSRYGERAALSLVRADSADDNSALALRE